MAKYTEDEVDIALVMDRIRHNAAWRMSDSYANLKWTWEDKVQTLPTWQEIEDDWEVLLQERIDTKYITDREAEYPLIKDQVDAIFKGFKNLNDAGAVVFDKEVTDWIDEVQAVKDKYPKPAVLGP